MGLCLEQVTSNQRGRRERDADGRTWAVSEAMAAVEVFPVCLSVRLFMCLSVSFLSLLVAILDVFFFLFFFCKTLNSNVWQLFILKI